MPVHRRKKISINILIPFIVLILFFSIMIWQKYRSSQKVIVAPPQSGTENIRSINLFFTADGIHLTRETRVLEPCENDVACLKSTLDELLNGPIGELSETVPDGVIVTSAAIEGNQATIEFNTQFSEAIPSGSAVEMLAVYAVVNTVAVNFPQIQKVKIEVEGNKRVLLHHLDLSEPLTPDYSLELSAPPETVEKPAKDPKGGTRSQ